MFSHCPRPSVIGRRCAESRRSGKQGRGIAPSPHPEDIGQVGKERTALQLGDLLALLGHLLCQLLDLLIHPQQHRDYGLAAGVIDRFGLYTLHAKDFAGRRLCPPTRLNAYDF